MTNEANTIWSPRGNQEGEYDPSSNFELSDSSGNVLVDSSSNFVVSGDVAFTLMPKTVWVDSPGN